MTADNAMTRRERDDLAALVRRRERVAKTAAAQRSAELLADFEQKLAAQYSFNDDATWQKLATAALLAVKAADAQVAARCRELGIPEQFRPSLNASWYGRGENAFKGRRAELRAAAKAHIDMLEKQAKTTIERRSVEVQTELLAGGLETDVARRFLQSMPTAEALMPPLNVAELEAAMPGVRPALSAAHYELDE